MKKLLSGWNQFFFRARSPLPMAIFRIIVSGVLIYSLILVNADLSTWYGDEAIVSFAAAAKCLPSFPCINLLSSELSLQTIVLIHSLLLISATTLLLGWQTRISAGLCFVLFQSFLRRNPFILSGSDELLSQLLFYLVLSNAGKCLSVDSYLATGRFANFQAKDFPWAQRLVQLQLCLIYLQTFFAKIQQADWQNGSALQMVFQTKELTNFPVPEFITHNLVICQLLTWSTLAIELGLPLLLWIRPCRNYVLAAAILFHVVMEYSLSIPMFQPLMIACLLCFIDAAVYRRFFTFFRHVLHNKKANIA